MTEDEPGEPRDAENRPGRPPRIPGPRDATARGATPPPPPGEAAGGAHGVPQPREASRRRPPSAVDAAADPPARRPEPAGPAGVAGTDETDVPTGVPGTGGPLVPAQADPEGARAATPPSGPTGRSGRAAGGYSHGELMSLLGAWALGACQPAETRAVEAHLGGCPSCAEEAIRLRDAVPLLEPQRTLDLDPALRPQVLASCLDRRPARLPLPSWAEPFEAETARLDALLHDMVPEEWQSPVRLRWFSGDSPVGRSTTVAGVLDHLVAVDGLLCPVLGLPDPLGEQSVLNDPLARTEERWQRNSGQYALSPHRVWRPWRDQGRSLVRAAGQLRANGERQVVYWTPEGYGGGSLSLADAFLDRAFACWVHAHDIAEAVSYPYGDPSGPQLRMLVDFTVRRLPVSIADRRRAGLASSPGRLVPAGEPGRSLHLEVEGSGGGDWYVPLDSPAAPATPEGAVAHVALEDVTFCKLASGRITPEEAAAGGDGDLGAIQDLLFATAALSRI